MKRILSTVCILTLFVSSQVWAQTVEYIHTDALGSPVAVTNSSGGVIERTVYEPYGAVVNHPLTNGPGFAGHVTDATTGLVYMQQRYYDPTLGRFLSVDPVSADEASGSNFNRYWYAENNPYTYRDPDGQLAFLVPLGIVCLKSCVAAAVWAVTIVGAIAAGAVVENALNEAQADPTPSDVSDQDDAKAPPGNGGKTDTKHGSDEHDKLVDQEIDKMTDKGFGDIRKNQAQVDANGNKVGDNRPDAQGTNPETGQREYVEVDRNAKRALDHYKEIMSNDPKGKCTLVPCP